MRLQAIIAKLPKTADNQPTFSDEVVWSIHDGRIIERMVFYTDDGEFEAFVRQVGENSVPFYWPVSKCYSTIGAATSNLERMT